MTAVRFSWQFARHIPDRHNADPRPGPCKGLWKNGACRWRGSRIVYDVDGREHRICGNHVNRIWMTGELRMESYLAPPVVMRANGVQLVDGPVTDGQNFVSGEPEALAKRGYKRANRRKQ